jgi:hypothetical protein
MKNLLCSVSVLVLVSSLSVNATDVEKTPETWGAWASR